MLWLVNDMALHRSLIHPMLCRLILNRMQSMMVGRETNTQAFKKLFCFLTGELADEKVKFVTGIAIGTAAWTGWTALKAAGGWKASETTGGLRPRPFPGLKPVFIKYSGFSWAGRAMSMWSAWVRFDVTNIRQGIIRKKNYCILNPRVSALDYG